MTFRKFLVVAACGLGAVLLGPRSFAQDHKGHDHKGHDHAGHDHAGHDHAGHDHAAEGHEGHGHGDAAEAAMMAAWMKAGAPCEYHAYLTPLVGKWTTATRYRHTEDAPWSASTGTSESKWIMDGRHIVEHFTSTSPEMPFVGMGISGYDNSKKQYYSTWIDSMSTTMMTMTGTIDDSHKVITYTGTYDDMMTGEKDKPQKSTTTIINENKVVLEMYQRNKEGKWFLHIEVVYTRA